MHLHEVLKIEISIFSISCTVMHIHPPTFELCSYRSCMPSLLLYAPVDTKRARMMPGSKIVLPSSDVEEYTGNILQSTVSRYCEA